MLQLGLRQIIFKFFAFFFPEFQALTKIIANSFRWFEFNFQPVELFWGRLQVPSLLLRFSRNSEKVVERVGNWSISIRPNLFMWSERGMGGSVNPESGGTFAMG